MPKSINRYARIAITLPRELLVVADRRARELDRSRSWVIAEAIRRDMAASATSLPESQPPAPQPGIGASRRAQLLADLRLSPEERVREAELTERATQRTRPTSRNSIVSFERYEDYLEWKRVQDAGG